MNKRDANTMLSGISMMTKRVVAEIDRLYRIRLDHNEELFTFAVDDGHIDLAANTTAIGYTTITDNVNFICCAWSAYGWEDGTPTTGGLPFTIEAKNMANGKYWHTAYPGISPIHSSFVGNDSIPTWFPQPMLLTKNTRIRWTLTNLNANTALDVRIDLIGYRIFTYDSVNWAVRR